MNNSYLGLIRQAQRGFDMDYHVQLSFENINAPELGGYGVDHVAVAEGLGCKAIRVTDPKDAQAAFATARELMKKHRVPVVVEFILERVTNIAMGTEIDNIVEFEEVLDLPLDEVGATRLRRAAAGRIGDSIMPKFAANLTMLFNEMPFVDRFAAAKAAGFAGVEYLFPYDFDKALLREQLEAHGLTQVLHNLPAGNWAGGERGIAILPDRADEFRDGVFRAIDYAKALDCRAAQLPRRHRARRCRSARAAARRWSEICALPPSTLARENIKLLVEPINTLDIPGFFLNGTEQAVQLISEVRSNNLFIQYDIYHMQIMEGDLARTMQEYLPQIAHIQLADNPGRNEPGTGEINYPFLFRHLDAIGYRGWIGCEYKPRTTTLEGLSWHAAQTFET